SIPEEALRLEEPARSLITNDKGLFRYLDTRSQAMGRAMRHHLENAGGCDSANLRLYLEFARAATDSELDTAIMNFLPTASPEKTARAFQLLGMRFLL